MPLWFTPSARAESYRFTLTRTQGEETIEVAQKLSDEPEAAIANLPAGASLHIRVSARNGSSESQPSEPITALVP